MTREDWMRGQLERGGVVPITGHGSVSDPHTDDESGRCTQCGSERAS